MNEKIKDLIAKYSEQLDDIKIYWYDTDKNKELSSAQRRILREIIGDLKLLSEGGTANEL